MGPILLLIVGGLLLIAGAELLVRGASRLAVRLGISPLIVGLTVVAFGTSAPELAVTVGAAYSGEADLALGNVVGSNIFNLLFILGLSAAITPLVVDQQLIRLDVPLMIGSAVLMGLLALDGRIGRLDGAILFSGVIGYTLFLIHQGRREPQKVQDEYAEAVGGAPRRHPAVYVVLMTAGMLLLVLGARWLVEGAVSVAQALGVSELVIGLTIVAAGTSLPEVATSVLASLRAERDIAVGNVIGSNIFNVLSVLGAGALLSPDGVPVPPGALTFDIPVMIAASITALPIFFTGYLIARWEGFLGVGYYAAYTVYLVLDAADHPHLYEFSLAMVFFVLPLTLSTIAVVTWRAVQAHRRHRRGAGAMRRPPSSGPGAPRL